MIARRAPRGLTSRWKAIADLFILTRWTVYHGPVRPGKRAGAGERGAPHYLIAECAMGQA